MTATTISLPANLPPAFQSMIDDLTTLTVDVTDALGSSIQIAEAILLAAEKGEEAILDAANAGSISAENHIDKPFPIRHDAVTWRPTGEQFMKEGAFPFYALIRTEDQDGSPMVLNVGGQSTVPTVYALWKSGTLAKYGEKGWPGIIRQIKTSAGWDLMKLNKYESAKKA